MTRLLIDADILVYKAIASTEQEIEWEPDVWTIHTDLNDALEAFNEQINSIVERSGINDYLLCFSDSENFRKKIYKEYKANRASTRKPVGFKPFRTKVIEQFRGVVKPTLEADDVLGILATKNPDTTIIVSDDKDLMQIPGRHLVGDEVIVVTERAADKMFYTQVLTGDPVDNYPGCPGVGKVKAEAILSKPEAIEDPWDFIVEAYEKAGLTEKDALVQARCARILRCTDWNEKKQKVILWNNN